MVGARVRYGKLRIAWSVAWGILAVLLIALWVRSCWWQDVVFFAVGSERMIMLESNPDRFFAETYSVTSIQVHSPNPWRTGIIRDGWGWLKLHRQVAGISHRMFDMRPGNSYTWVRIPLWCPLLTCAAVAAISAGRTLNWRLSLSTLLIATTLVAVGLGLIVWAAK